MDSNKTIAKAPLSTFDKTMQVLNEMPITEQHVSKVIDTLSDIAMMRSQQAIEESKSENRIKLMIAKFENDTSRCERSVEYLKDIGGYLSDEEKGKLITSIIKLQLGVPAEKL